MKEIWNIVKPAFGIFGVMVLLCGFLYTGIVTGMAQTFFPDKANGSIITGKTKDGNETKVGSDFLAQEFAEPKYFIGRPLGVSNLSPNSKELKRIVEDRVEWWYKFGPNNSTAIPMDLVTSSGSGVDPNISVEAAEFQIPRVAAERGMNEEKVREIVKEYTSDKFLGIIGEPAVNVLKVNLALDGFTTSD